MKTLPLSLTVAVITAVPFSTPVTTPEPSTVAADPLETDQETLELVASAGLISAVSCFVQPTPRSSVLGVTETPSTSIISGYSTVVNSVAGAR